MGLKDKFRGYRIETMLNQLIDAKKYNFCNTFIIEKIRNIVIMLMYNKKDNIIELIQSDDNETFRLGMQMLFEDYLDQYNQLCENPRWEILVSSMIEYYIKIHG